MLNEQVESVMAIAFELARIREDLTLAAVNCEHQIDADCVRLWRDETKEGTALSQLVDRVAAVVAQSVPDLDTMRTDFHQWCATNGYKTGFVNGGECPMGRPVYEDHRTHAAWWAFQKAAKLYGAQSAPTEPPQEFESAQGRALASAWAEGWAQCRDAEYVGEEAESEAFNQSATLAQCLHADQTRFQGGLSNDELRRAWSAKLPNVIPTDEQLTAFALGIEAAAQPSQAPVVQAVQVGPERLAAQAAPTEAEYNPLLIDGVQHDPLCLKVYRSPLKECDCGASSRAAQPSQAPVVLAVQAREYPPLPWGNQQPYVWFCRTKDTDLVAAFRAYVDADRASSGATTQAVRMPAVTAFNVGRFCLSEDDCIAQRIDFSAYERGVADAAEAFSRNT